MRNLQKSKGVFWGALLSGLMLLIVASVFPPTRMHAQFAAPQTWLGTAGGSVNTITFSVHNIATLNDLLGVPLRFLPSGANTGSVTVTINLDGGGSLGPVALKRRTSNIGLQAPSGFELITAVLAEITYDGTQFVLTSPIDMTPVGDSVEVRSLTQVPLGTLVEDGSCVSQTTYAALFSVIGTSYNAGAPVGCSGGQFAVPYSNGTMFLALDNQGAHTANRVTNGGSGCTATGSGVLCGNQSHTQSVAEMPAHNHGGATGTPTISMGQILVNDNTAGEGVGAGNTRIQTSGGTGHDAQPTFSSFSITTSPSVGTSSISSQGGGSAMSILNPVLTGFRAIKY